MRVRSLCIATALVACSTQASTVADSSPPEAPAAPAADAPVRFDKFGMTFDVPAGTNLNEVNRGKLQMVTIDQADNETALQLMVLGAACPDPASFARRQYEGTRSSLPPSYTVQLTGEDASQRTIGGTARDGVRVRFAATAGGTTVDRTIEAYAVPAGDKCGVVLLNFSDAKFPAEKARIDAVLASFQVGTTVPASGE